MQNLEDQNEKEFIQIEKTPVVGEALTGFEKTETAETVTADEKMAMFLGEGFVKSKEVGTSTSSPVIQVQMAKNNPQKIKNLLATNIQPNTGKKIQDAKLERKRQALIRFGYQNVPAIPAISPVALDPLAISLSTLFSGQSTSSASQNDLILEAKTKFSNYIIQSIASRNTAMAARIFAVNHFGDMTLFDKFEGLEKEMMEAYDGFLKLVNKTFLGK
jgi:hypothetical protein